MAHRKLVLVVFAICLAPMLVDQADAALITRLDGYDSDFTIVRGKATFTLRDGLPPGLVRQMFDHDLLNAANLTDADFLDSQGAVANHGLGHLSLPNVGSALDNSFLNGSGANGSLLFDASISTNLDSEVPVPEPGSLWLLGSGGVALITRFRRRRAPNGSA